MSAYATIYLRIDEGKYKTNEGIFTFRNDLKEVYGLQANPKFDLLFSISWEQGHAHGLTDVLGVFNDLVELVR
ncbi:hypothetical protein M5X00_26030 [Paenibacillus alvei]|uniref:hypothetical protein n=1 Tax=Paenibacillus alvei TaxID=44250 RepID=UPI0002E4EFC4|nr:hypothetical protein [Paenibacillus alvei]MCY9544811.1 hypothetical protein [Paenibacillus alvei]MCY9707709.1 hypothetical protein [Paenibacillus alvei]MCY9757690.1 hypothetical protein [Paenibacillus alvei]MEC0082778.1 hypothetical protein [Paenibacillus alvei]